MNPLNPLVQEALGSILRAGLAILSGYVVSAGIWTSEDASKYVAAAALALLALGWSFWQKYKSRLTLVTALSSSTKLTENEAKSIVSTGNAPPVSSASDEVPKKPTDK